MLKDRIKQIRKAHDLTQQEFADRLNIKRGTIANYELGRNEPIDAVITLICREFGISEDWLRYGTGKMKPSASREEEMEALMRSVLKGNNEFIKAVTKALCSRTEKELETLEKMLWDIVYNLDDAKKAQAESRPGQKIIKIAGRDGSLEERTLTDEDANEYLARIDQLPDAGDDL